MPAARRPAAAPKARRPEPGADGDTEARILAAAHAVFVRRGTAGARMQEIAAEAGVNHALLHYYFRSKQQLADAVFRGVAARLLPPVLEALLSDAALEDKVRRVIALELEVLAESPYLPGYLVSELGHHPERVGQLVRAVTGREVGDLGAHLRARLGPQLAAGAADGTLRPVAVDQFVANLLSLCFFPFAARPLLGAVLGFDDAGFRAFVDRRREELPAFFLAALRP